MNLSTGAPGSLPEQQPERLSKWRDPKAPLNHGSVVITTRFHPLAHRHAANFVIKTHTVRRDVDGFELSQPWIDWPAPHFPRIGAKRAWIDERKHLARLPAGIDSIREPDVAPRRGQLVLTFGRLHARSVIRPLRHGKRSERNIHWSAPNRRDAQQVRVEARPATVTQIQDEATRRKIVRRPTRADFSRVQHRREEGEIGFDE